MRSARPPKSASRSSASRPRSCRSFVAELTGGRLVARVLKQAGVGHVFTLCGGHILPTYDGCLDEGIALIAGRARRPRARAAGPRARARQGAGQQRGLVRERRPRSGGVPEHGDDVDGDLS
ncbi:MAG: hypothetical protein DME02_17005 [Candidatus Rokuibacteriota bacterium]|nr:MAG: hypothetical protein DME02_17005 [Candidatus Rokubacteria bacterium]